MYIYCKNTETKGKSIINYMQLTSNSAFLDEAVPANPPYGSATMATAARSQSAMSISALHGYSRHIAWLELDPITDHQN